eukprot:11728389-Ditylum_brightwellii.AAC.1
MEVQGLLVHIEQGTVEEHEEMRHVVIPLLGEFKGKQGKTKSGFQSHLWTDQVILMLKYEGVTSGPVMRHEGGTLLSSSLVEEEFHSQLTHVQSTHPHLIEPSVE